MPRMEPLQDRIGYALAAERGMHGVLRIAPPAVGKCLDSDHPCARVIRAQG